MKRFKRLYIEITNVCNLDCSFCTKTCRPSRFMTTDEFEHILIEAQPYSDHVYLHVKGEPLLHPKIDELLDLCEAYGFAANITTNGTLLSDKLPMIGKKALRQVNISLHSAHDNALALQRYLDNIVAFTKRTREETNTNVTLRLWNMDSDQSTNLEKERNRSILDVIECAFGVEHIEDRLHGNRGIKLGPRFYLNHGVVFEWPSLHAEVVSERGYCLGLRSQLGILVDGTVIPCCLDGEGVINLGNVLDQPLGEIIESPRAHALIEGFTNRCCKEELCRRCGYRDRFGSEFRPSTEKLHEAVSAKAQEEE